ncbi:hypothetical protein EDC96DRAFT_578923 [Choanephora cucurbitarum]|nr:hypothetical protein EDC96DRAFT_578923 [Choanephora cucurbitarum]
MTPKSTRELLFQYYFLSEVQPLNEFLIAHKQSFDDLLNLKSNNEKPMLDKTSLLMMNKYDQLSNNEVNVLKLGFSYIVDLDEQSIVVLNDLPSWCKISKSSETEDVCRINELLKTVFDSTELYPKIGEICAVNTKEVCSVNETNFSGGEGSSYLQSGSLPLSRSSKGSACGRKVDLMVKNKHEEELAYCEFKAVHYRALIEYQ